MVNSPQRSKTKHLANNLKFNSGIYLYTYHDIFNSTHLLALKWAASYPLYITSDNHKRRSYTQSHSSKSYTVEYYLTDERRQRPQTGELFSNNTWRLGRTLTVVILYQVCMLN